MWCCILLHLVRGQVFVYCPLIVDRSCDGGLRPCICCSVERKRSIAVSLMRSTSYSQALRTRDIFSVVCGGFNLKSDACSRFHSRNHRSLPFPSHHSPSQVRAICCSSRVVKTIGLETSTNELVYQDFRVHVLRSCFGHCSTTNRDQDS